MNLYQKLAKIRKKCEVIQKDAKGFNYKYVTLDAILAKVTAGMEEHKVSLISEMVSGTANVVPYHYVKTKLLQNGKVLEENVNEVIVSAEMVFRWVNDEDPTETITVPWFLTGAQSDPSQAMGSGITYATRYFLASYFSIAQPDSDPDKWRSLQQEAREAESIAVAESLIGTLDQLVKKRFISHPDDKDKIIEFFKARVKNGVYSSIKEPEVIKALLDEYNDTFESKEEK